jgi:hypothetical protein
MLNHIYHLDIPVLVCYYSIKKQYLLIHHVTNKQLHSFQQSWIERQAVYVRFLWEEYQTSSFDIKDSDNIWQHTYDTLTKEFNDFKELHEKMEQKVKEDALRH